MTKSEIVELLKKQGYEAEIVEKIPFVSLKVKSKKDFSKELKELKIILKENDYKDSFGISYNN